MMINEEELKGIHEEIIFWKGVLDNTRDRLRKLHKERDEAESELRDFRISSSSYDLYDPGYYYYSCNRTWGIKAREEKIANLNEQIDYFEKVALYVNDEINKLYTKAGMLLV